MADAIGATFCQYGLDHRLLGSSRDPQVDEAGAGDLDGVDQGSARRVGHHGGNKSLRQLARVFLERLGQLHSNIASNVAMRRVAWAFQDDVGLQVAAGQNRRQGSLKQGNNLLFLRSKHGNRLTKSCRTGRRRRKSAPVGMRSLKILEQDYTGPRAGLCRITCCGCSYPSMPGKKIHRCGHSLLP